LGKMNKSLNELVDSITLEDLAEDYRKRNVLTVQCITYNFYVNHDKVNKRNRIERRFNYGRKKLKFDTLQVHAGRSRPYYRFKSGSIYQTTSYVFNSPEHAAISLR